MRGLTHIYTGNGKGKTTAAIGLGIRAYGRGFKVLMVQFLKGAETGELMTIRKLAPDFVLVRDKEVKKFTWTMNEEELKQLKKETGEVFKIALEAARSNEWDMVIMDEVIGAVTCGLVTSDEIIELVNSKAEKVEIVMTGRNAPPELIEIADYVSEINAVKHPFEKGVPARKGIES